MQLKGILSWMVFATDCDKTLVHYEGNGAVDKELTQLPASSGSGQVATVSQDTLNLLESIANEGTTIICATGMRVSTLMQREPFFPSVKYWACENGGRIFRRVEGRPELVEFDEWRDLIVSNREAVEALHALSTQLTEDGWKVDTNGYATMFRVKGKDVASIVSRIPTILEYTFNLGHLDVQLPGCGKLPAIRWLIENIIIDRDKEATADSSEMKGNEDERKTIPYPYLFMGDDDNDIPAADAATAAYITMPCSNKMQEYITHRHQLDEASSHTSTELSIDGSLIQVAIDSENKLTLYPKKNRSELQVAVHTRHEGTEELLRSILERIRQNKDIL